MAKNVTIAGETYNDVPSIQVPLSSGQGNATFYDEVGNLAITQNGTNIDVSGYATVSVNVSGGGGGGKTGAYNIVSIDNGNSTQNLVIIDANGNGEYDINVTENQDGTQSLAIVDAQEAALNLQTKTKSYTPTESQQTEVITYDSAYDGLDTVNVTVGAISSSYVGSGIDRNDSSDLSVSGATVTVPSGYYASSASKSVESGTEGTPTATKGTVSNNSVAITPSVTNTAGYISGGTKTGTAVTVSASELVSGSQTITSNQTVDVTNLAEVVVNVSSSFSVGTATWTNTSNQTTSHEFSSLSGTPKAAFLRCTSQLTRSTSNTYYYIADIFWDGTNCRGNYHLRSNGTFNNVATDGGFSVTTGTKAITFASSGARNTAPGSFYNGTYELVYLY